MRVLQINCVYASGSTGKITESLHRMLAKRNIESYVIYGRGNEQYCEARIIKIGNELSAKVSHMFTMFTGNPYGGCFLQTYLIIRQIERIKPDVVHLQCINGYFVNVYRLLRYLSHIKMPTVLTLHAEFMFTGTCGYAFDCNHWMEEKGCHSCPQWKQESGSLIGDRTKEAWGKMQEAFSGFDKDKLSIISVSPWLQNRAERSVIMREYSHDTVFNGVDNNIFCVSKKTKVNKKITVFHATAFFSSDPDHIKGGYYVIKLAEAMPEVQFVVAGSYEEGITVPNNVQLLGKLADQKELAHYYSLADITVLTSRRETFSMVCAESLCCGTPVVGFYAGAPETISLPACSRFVEYGDVQAMKTAIYGLLSKEFSKEDIEKEAHKIYGQKAMAENYIAVYRKLMEKNDE